MESVPLIALSGVLVGSTFTIIGTWLTNKANLRRLEIQLEHEKEITKENIIRSRLEELFILSDKYFNALISYQLPLRMVMKGEISFNDALDLHIKWSDESKDNFQRVDMIIEMYFTELKKPYNEILLIRDDLNILSEKYKKEYIEGNNDGQKYLNLFQPKLEELTKKITHFRKNIIKII